MSLRIAHVTATFPPYRGGTGNVCFHNARELGRRGHQVTVFTAALGNAPAEEQNDVFRVRRLRPLVRVGNAPVLLGLPMALRGFDLVHLHYPFFGGDALTFAATRDVPLVITYHQDVLLSGTMAVVERALRQSAGRATLRSATRMLFTSLDYGEASYIRPLLEGREAQIGELPNGVDSDAFRPAEPSVRLRTQLRLRPEDQVVLLVAGLDQAHYFKGVDVLLQALTWLPAHVKALVVGDGDLRPSYTERATELGVGERVIFAGRVGDAELPDYYRLADLTVLPSITMGEAFGLVLLESLACGTPVIASNLPGVRTVVSPGHDGLLVTPGNGHALASAINQLLYDRSLRTQMGQRGRAKVVASYDWKQIGARLEAIYWEALAEHAAGSAQCQQEQS